MSTGTEARGFCPACRADRSESTPHLELSSPAMLAGGVLLVAVVAWVWVIRASTAMGSMGLGPPGSFAAGWTLMTAATMLPSALPLLHRFGQEVEGRRHWPLAVGLLAATYLAVWLGFGLVLYAIYTALGMPWSNQPIVGAAAIGLAAIYGLTPLKQAAQARCRELCALHEALPFNLLRAGAVAGFRYGRSCVSCNALLMAAMLAVGMTDLAWAVVVSVFAVLYRFAPRAGVRYELLVSLTLGVAAAAYFIGW